MTVLDTLSTMDLTTPLKKPGGTYAYTLEVEKSTKDLVDKLIAQGLLQLSEGTYAELWCPTSGATTSAKVHRTRMEYKRSEPLYLKDYKTFVLRVRSELLTVNHKQNIVFLQLHCDDGDDPTVKFFYDNGEIKIGFRDYDKDTDPKKKVIGKVGSTPCILNVEMRITGLDVVVTCNGVEFQFKLTEARAARPHVPHVGIYNQCDQGQEDEPANDGTRLRIHEFYEGELEVIEVPAEPTLAEKLTKELLELEQGYYSGDVGLGTAKASLNDISTRIKDVEDKDERYALNVKAAAVKALLK